MISLRFDPRFPAPEALTAPGGFVWWYLDLTDGAGNGVVLIWSFGLPFLPGYADAARKGQGQSPASRPSLNVAVYKGCLLYTSPSPRDRTRSRMPSSA